MDQTSIDDSERKFIDNHPILEQQKIPLWFIFNNYEKCHYFLKDVLESESITVREHRILKDMMKSKIRNETRGKHILPFITGMVSLRIFFKTKSYLFKTILFFGYYLMIFDMSYTSGLHLFNLFQFPGIFRALLRLNDGQSIQSMQTKLFIKKVLLDEHRITSGKLKRPSWRDSYIINEVFIKNILWAKKSLYIKTA